MHRLHAPRFPRLPAAQGSQPQEPARHPPLTPQLNGAPHCRNRHACQQSTQKPQPPVMLAHRCAALLRSSCLQAPAAPPPGAPCRQAGMVGSGDGGGVGQAGMVGSGDGGRVGSDRFRKAGGSYLAAASQEPERGTEAGGHDSRQGTIKAGPYLNAAICCFSCFSCSFLILTASFSARNNGAGREQQQHWMRREATGGLTSPAAGQYGTTPSPTRQALQ